MADKIIRICLDAGHYGNYNQSPAVKGYYEAKAMWTLHLLLKRYLEKHGFEVVTTRDVQANDLELTVRGKMSLGCDLFLSLHSNAVGSYVNDDVDYVAMYRLVDDNTTKIDEISEEIAFAIVPVISEVMGVRQGWAVKQRKSENDRNGDGLFNDNYYGVLHGARTVGTPALILEHSFHTNTKVTNWLLDEGNLDRLAKAEAEVISKYFGMTKKEETPSVKPNTSNEPKKYYRVRKSWDDVKSQIGAYEVLDNAINNCPEGYAVYDWNGKEVYSKKKAETPRNEKVTVLEWQESAIADGFEFPLFGADGIYGAECEDVAEIAIIKNRGEDCYLYRNLTKLVQRVVGVEEDGLAGELTDEAIRAYQKAHGLEPDGCVGLLTWKVILGV